MHIALISEIRKVNFYVDDEASKNALDPHYLVKFGPSSLHLFCGLFEKW